MIKGILLSLLLAIGVAAPARAIDRKDAIPPTGSVGTDALAAGAVDTTKLGSGAVDTSKHLKGSVTADQLGNAAVDTTKLSSGAVDTSKHGKGSVTTDQIGNASVDTTKLGSGAVDTSKIGKGAVDTTKIAPDAVGAAQILNGSVGSNKFAVGGGLNWVINPSSPIFFGGTIGYIPYTAVPTTMTVTTTAEVVFSTMVLPAGFISRAGQNLRVICRFAKARNANSVTFHTRFNNAGALTDIGNTQGNSSSSTSNEFTDTADLTWLSTGLWINSHAMSASAGFTTGSPGSGNVPAYTQTFNEAAAMTFNCTCAATTTNGDCSFLDMRMEHGGM